MRRGLHKKLGSGLRRNDELTFIAIHAIFLRLKTKIPVALLQELVRVASYNGSTLRGIWSAHNDHP
jgi:hypothetical protein